MIEIAREYMQCMDIVNTQYIVCRHTDKEHQHLHIVANRVDNDGNTISNRNDAIRNVAVCKAITREYGLHFAKGKVKYQIYDAVKTALPHCNCWSELCEKLVRQGIEINFKFNCRNGKIIGVSFTKDEVSFSGSWMDRSMGFYKMDSLLNGRVIDNVEWRNNLHVNTRQMDETGADKAAIYTSDEPFEQAANLTYTDNQAAPSGNGDFTDTGSNTNIVQVGIGVLIELYVQPYQAKISSGGGGGN